MRVFSLAKSAAPAALVGTWMNKDGIGLKFTKDRTVKLSGLGLSLGGDTFSYETDGKGTLTLTASVAGVSAEINAPYTIFGKRCISN